MGAKDNILLLVLLLLLPIVNVLVVARFFLLLFRRLKRQPVDCLPGKKSRRHQQLATVSN